MAGVAPHAHRAIAVLVGPESCGKTTLANYLGRTLAAPVVPEVARTYLTPTAKSRVGASNAALVGSYDRQDLLAISERQVAAQEQVLAATDAPIVINDTDLTVIDIWWQEKFGPPSAEFMVLRQRERQLSRTYPRAYLLCYPDLVWQPDPLRENPTDRRRLFGAYLEVLQREGWPFRVIWGQGAHRRRLALEYCRHCLLYTSPSPRDRG